LQFLEFSKHFEKVANFCLGGLIGRAVVRGTRVTLRPISRAYRRLPPFSQIPHLTQSQQWSLEYKVVFENETSLFGSIDKALD
jgi:hypothetical protein